MRDGEVGRRDGEFPPNVSSFRSVPVWEAGGTFTTEGIDSFGFLVNSRAPGNPARQFAFILRGEFDMFRFLSRVVVVFVFALSLNIAVVPAAQAKPFESGRVNSGVSKGWVDVAFDWLNWFLGQPKDRTKDTTQGPKKVIANDGGQCIDPWGNPKPCP